ncbi:S26 family signal peptidase [Streptomyces sp. NPDC018026]|uniref:S26 family signal peptidase n=1 Tax=Streptomyces sp. NPDC018026 TaxID=3365031 RepID=UPI0037A9055B
MTVESIYEAGIDRGDVVLVRVPGWYGGAPVVQRVIGLGGDHVESRDGVRVAVNGKEICPRSADAAVTPWSGPYA